jgi:hypothetical protein
MTVKELKEMKKKTPVHSFRGTVTTGNPPEAPSELQSKFNEHPQVLIVADDTGDDIRVVLLRASQHMKSDVIGKQIVFDSGTDDDGLPVGLYVDRWKMRNGREVVQLVVDAKGGAKSHVIKDGAAGKDPLIRYTQSSGNVAQEMARKLEWCWNAIDWVEDENIRQRLATTLWIEMNMKKIDIPAAPRENPDYQEMLPPEDPPMIPKSVSVSFPEPPETQPEPEPEPVQEPAAVAPYTGDDHDPEFIDLRDNKIIPAFGEVILGRAWRILVEELDTDDPGAVVALILEDTKSFRQLLLEIQESDDADDIPFK